eukprot:2103509-Prymnesium_polylepis.1
MKRSEYNKQKSLFHPLQQAVQNSSRASASAPARALGAAAMPSLFGGRKTACDGMPSIATTTSRADLSEPLHVRSPLLCDSVG